MKESAESDPLLATDQHLRGSSFHVILVTPVEFATFVVADSAEKSILPKLKSGTEAFKALKAAAPAGQMKKQLLLTNLESIQWHENESDLILHFRDDATNKSHRTTCFVSNSEGRNRVVEAIQQVVGNLNISQQPVSVWRIGKERIIFSALIGLPCFLLAMPDRSHPDPNSVNTEALSGRKAAFGAVINLIGRQNMPIIGCILIAGAMVSWYLAYKKRPQFVTASVPVK